MCLPARGLSANKLTACCAAPGSGAELPARTAALHGRPDVNCAHRLHKLSCSWPAAPELSFDWPAWPAAPVRLQVKQPSEQEVLRARHLTYQQVTRLEEAWRSNPGASGELSGRTRGIRCPSASPGL